MVKRVAAPILDKYYLLEPMKKQKHHDDTPPDESGIDERYSPNSNPTTIGRLTEKACTAANIFVDFAFGDNVPSMPWINEYENKEKRFHFENEKCAGFLGVGKEDMAHMWHMLVIPKIEDELQPPIRWIFDLEPCHIELLHKMRASALTYISHNRKYFMEKYPDLAPRWLRPENIRIGFHTVPTVAYLHMHVLVGPITKFGNDCADRWVSFEKVNEYLIQDKDMNVLLNSYRI